MKCSTPLFSVLLLLVFTQFAESAEVLFLLDRSGSMDGDKLTVAKKTLTKLLDNPEATGQTGLMVFGGDCQDAVMVIPPGDMPMDLETQLAAISAQGGTPITYALENAARQFSGPVAEQHIVLISDGAETCKGDPCQAVRSLANQGIQVKFHVVEFGRESSKRYRGQLQCIADAGGGVYRRISSPGSFDQTLRSIHSGIQTGSLAKKPKFWLLEHFDATSLAWQWDVLKPNPRRYRVHNGHLEITAALRGDLVLTLPENTFRLKRPMPPGDWSAAMHLTVDFQTQKELFFMGIYNDRDNYLLATLWGVSGCEDQCVQLNADLVDRHQGSYQWNTGNIWKSDLNTAKIIFSEAMKALPQPLTVRLTKRKDIYTMSVHAGPDKTTEWMTLKQLTVSGKTPDKFIFGLYQTAPVETSTKMRIDWVKIE
ncbi:MAG: VWA domain-containing protein [Gammaproteobacteria bacterium]|nr:VWA domain-containing protein [Gammaproteobacteria bacterium]